MNAAMHSAVRNAGRRRIPALAAGVALAAFAAACASPDAAKPTAGNSGGSFTIGLANQQESVTFPAAIAKGANALIVSATDPTALCPTLNSAMKRGITVVTYDSDAPTCRQLFVNQASTAQIGTRTSISW